MTEQAQEEAYLESLLPMQRLIIAKAALAGARFEQTISERQIRTPSLTHEFGRAQWVTHTMIDVYMPDGEYLGRFEDRYEASCFVVGHLEGSYTLPGKDMDKLFKVIEP